MWRCGDGGDNGIKSYSIKLGLLRKDSSRILFLRSPSAWRSEVSFLVTAVVGRNESKGREVEIAILT